MRSKKRHHNDGLAKRCGCPRREWTKCVHPWHLQFQYRNEFHRCSLNVIASTLGEPKPQSKSEAKKLADCLRVEIRAGRNPLAQPAAQPAVTSLTFGDVVDRYVAEYLGRRETSNGVEWSGQHVRGTTGKNASYHLAVIRQVAVPTAHGKTVRLESKPFTAVTTTDVKAVQAARRSHGAVGCNRVMTRLRHLFNWAVAEGMIANSPFKRGEVTLVKLDVRAETERTRRLEADEEGRLLHHASPHLHALIVAALFTGCRLGELLSLQWKQIRCTASGEAQLIELPAAKTKTHENRTIPVSSDLRAVLEMRRTDPKGVALPPEAFVFGNPVGEQRVSIKTAWGNTCRRAGISNLHFHDLRREFACRLLESSVDLHDVRDFLGHANITTTSRYLRSSPVRLAEALERMERLAETIVDTDAQPHLAEVR